ncbi:carbohydrate ABC transporter permease [Kineococcus rhizosphaerae]|uniref:Carbohydrate ABC transporter membrane protein 1 (CUT1 family) n=1 Tax=Kineococcus rhizosphaerae TaxID=559628 RepID=A0A2T0R3H2_9ACTN|nr:sugar ABC transporter permease [Kineococcus rhizosphaerae]PRY14594.1 carbohydrate ABC transporter membrane protein 1 (CUT1 family) [Kineococcus rhizosphaerae]
MSSASLDRGFRRSRSRPPGTTPAAGNRRSPLRFWPQYVAVSPFFLIFAAFGLFPLGFSAWLAFHRWDGVNPVTFAGLDQFRFLLEDATFRKAVVNTIIIWIMATVPMLAMSLAIAAMLNAVRRFRTFYQVVLFLPSVTSIVAIAIFFKAIFNNQVGVVNQVLEGIGLPGVEWLNGYWTIKIVLATLMTWQWVGYNAIIYFAGLQAISTEVYEAAKLDGAGALRTFVSITVPLLRPIILFTVVVSTIGGMQTFAEPQVLFGSNASINPNSGGPGQAGLTMVLYFYQQAFNNNNYGYGAAIAYGVFAVIAVFALLNWRLTARSEK